MSQEKIKIAPRREAQSFAWSDLDASQKKAYVSTLQLLIDYSKQAQAYAGNNKSIIQRHHNSQIIFLDGKRGTGKTSVLSTLVYTTEQKENWTSFTENFDHANSLEKELSEISFSKQVKPIRWLKILDLEMLPEPTNLLASLCVRIEDAFKGSVNTPFYTSQLVEKSKRDAWRSFSAAMHDFALGWKTNLQERKETDPDTYSSEVLRVERARLQLADFSDVLANLSDFYKATHNLNQKPVFVLPVDDADLNPQRFLDLLDLSRRAKAPNLVFLVLGNYENLAQLMEWKYATEISAILPVKEIENTTGKYVNEMEEFAAHWSYSALQKLIPPGNHLIELKPYTFEEAARHQSAGCEFNLQQLLTKVELPEPRGIIKDYLSPHQNLWELITLESWKQDSNLKCQLTSVLSGPIRSIENLSRETVAFLNDLPDTPARLTGKNLISGLSFYFKKALSGALSAEPGLPYWVRQRLAQLFYPVGNIPDYQLIEAGVEVIPTRLPIAHDASDTFSGSSNQCVYVFRQCDEIALRIPGPSTYPPVETGKNKLKKDVYNLSDWRANWIFLNHDINILNPTDTIQRFDFSHCTQHWAASGKYFKELGNEQLLLSWPAPNWLLFNHLEMFRLYWNTILEHSRFDEVDWQLKSPSTILHSRHRLEFTAYIWCKIINDIIQKQSINVSVSFADYISKKSDSWNGLIESMESFLKNNGSTSGLRKRYMAEWIQQFLLIFSPEMGIFKKNPLLSDGDPDSKENKLTHLIKEADSRLLYLRANNILSAIDSRSVDVVMALKRLLAQTTSHWFEIHSTVKMREVLATVLARTNTHNMSPQQQKLWSDLQVELTKVEVPIASTENSKILEHAENGESLLNTEPSEKKESLEKRSKNPKKTKKQEFISREIKISQERLEKQKAKSPKTQAKSKKSSDADKL